MTNRRKHIHKKQPWDALGLHQSVPLQQSKAMNCLQGVRLPTAALPAWNCQFYVLCKIPS